jgi:hypothetical protein
MGSNGIRGDKMSDLWDGKTLCWTFFNCSKYVYPRCPAYLNPESPCWECAYTQNEILLSIKKDCKTCKVFKLYFDSQTDLDSEISSKKDST